MSRKIPRWTTAFLRALERTGEAQAAAKDAGVDKSTAYARRRAHAEFAQAWAEALRAHHARAEAEEHAEIARVKKDPSTISKNGSPPRGKPGEEVTAANGQVK